MPVMNQNSKHSKIQDQEQEKILLEPLRYISQVPGKQVRGKLAQAFNVWLKIPDEKLLVIGEVVQLLHNASLLLDDIEDNSKLRRGIPVAHSIYGVASTINSANYTIFLALEKVLKLEHPAVTTIFTEQLLELHRGQGMEIYWRDSYTCPTEDEYKQMVVRKTGGLFGLAVRLMQLFSTNDKDLSKLTAILGLYFQIRDDYSNLCSSEYAEHKSYCEDLTEGKFSFPIIHGIRSKPDDLQIINILRQRPSEDAIKRYCVSLLEKYGSIEYTKTVLGDLDQQALNELTKLGGNPVLESILVELRTWK